jgi:two-component system, chemotaxis family, chemotaxis protein CheY
MHILIVDDSRIMRQIIKRTLIQAGFEDFEFSEAANGHEALESYSHLHPDLILSDWNMPEMDGLSLLQEIRKIDSDVPFGLITAQSTASLRESAQYHGAHFLLSKPFTPESLGTAVKAVLS